MRKRLRDVSLTSKGLFVVAVPLLALLAVALVFRGLVDSQRRAQELVVQTLEVRRQIQLVLTLVVDAETGGRGYALSGRPEFLEPLDEARARLPIELERLRGLVADDGAQALRGRTLERLVSERLETLARLQETTSLSRPDELEPHETLLVEGKTRMDRVRGVLAEMQAEEERLQALGLDALARSETDLRLAGWLGVIAGVFGGLLASVTFARGIVARIRQVADNAELLAKGEPLRGLPRGTDEIGDLGRRMETAAELLREREHEVAEVDTELRNGLSLLRATLDATTDGIAAIDTAGRVVVHNDRFLKMLNVPDADALVDGRNEAFDPIVAQLRDPAGTVTALRQDLVTPDARGSRLVELSDGRILEVGFHPQRLDDAIVGRVWSVRDVTERARYQQELERARLDAERAREEAEQAREEAERAREEAERANRAKSEFLSRMSHELRTPLNAVLGFGQLLEMDVRDQRQRDAVSHVMKAGRHLLDLINEVLDSARIESGRVALSLEDVDVGEAVAEVLDLVTPLAAAAGISLEGLQASEAGPTARADRQRLKQVLLNLVNNAIKYNRADGSVRVVASASERRVRVEVIDTGPGIAPESLPRLFTPFERIGAERGDVEGTGLGLALSKRLIEAMEGTIGVQSRLGEGSTFWIDLGRGEPDPTTAREAANRRPAEDRPSSASSGGRRPRIKIVYVEDNLSNIRLIERLVERRPHVELITAMQGGLAIELARHHRPELILLDLHLPDIHGADVLASLRADPATAEIPVVILSADATPGQIDRLLEAGATAYLTKPLEMRGLLELIDGTTGTPRMS